MPSQTTSADSSHDANSTVPSDHGELPVDALDHTAPESVPSLDRDLSTDLASDDPSTADASLLMGTEDDDDSLEEPEISFDATPADSVSVYAPSQYPSVPDAYRIEGLHGDSMTV